MSLLLCAHIITSWQQLYEAQTLLHCLYSHECGEHRDAAISARIICRRSAWNSAKSSKLQLTMTLRHLQAAPPGSHPGGVWLKPVRVWAYRQTWHCSSRCETISSSSCVLPGNWRKPWLSAVIVFRPQCYHQSSGGAHLFVLYFQNVPTRQKTPNNDSEPCHVTLEQIREITAVKPVLSPTSRVFICCVWVVFLKCGNRIRHLPKYCIGVCSSLIGTHHIFLAILVSLHFPHCLFCKTVPYTHLFSCLESSCFLSLSHI